MLKNKIKYGTSLNNVPEYKVYMGMKARCYNPNNDAYHNYGGRGIKVCDRWLESFDNFYDDMGARPSDEYSIDRYPDNDGDYEPDNCRWATKVEQTMNRRNTLKVEYKGEIVPLADVCRALNVDYSHVHQRMRNQGLSLEDALTLPLAPNAGLYVNYKGKSKTISEWARFHNLDPDLVWQRFRVYNWSIEETLETPVSKIKYYEYKGKLLNLTQWCEVLNLNFSTISHRISVKNMTFEEAIETPVKDHWNLIEYRGKTQSMKEWCKDLKLDYWSVQKRFELGWTTKDCFEKPFKKSTKITYQGKTQSIKKWCDELGLESIYNRIRMQIYKGKDPIEVLETAIAKLNKVA